MATHLLFDVLRGKAEVTPENFEQAMQQAIEIEIATIPVYLYTYYSINRVPNQDDITADLTKRLRKTGMKKPQAEQKALEMSTEIMVFANKAGAMIVSVAVEEMLHMSLSSNVMQALVGPPELVDKSPAEWPAYLPGHEPPFPHQPDPLFDAITDESVCYADREVAEADLRLNPISRLFRHRYPVVAYYRQFTGGKQPELPLPGISYAAVVRNKLRLGLFELQPVQYHLLNRLAAGDSFPRARQRTIDEHQLDPSRFDRAWVAWKERWLEAGFFVRTATTADEASES